MSSPDDHDDERTGPQTPEEAEFLAAYRDLGDADRVLLWSALLTEWDRRPTPDEAPPKATERRR